MEAMSLYERLTCGAGACTSDTFTKQYFLKWKDKSGTIEENAGYVCTRCKSLFVSERSIRNVRLRQKEREIEELREDVNALSTPNEGQDKKERKSAAVNS